MVSAYIDSVRDLNLEHPNENRLASIDTKLARLTTMTQITIGLLVVLLGSQAALWSKLAEIAVKFQ